MYKIWFKRELKSQQPSLARKQVATALWKKCLLKSELPLYEVLANLKMLQNFLCSKLPAKYPGKPDEYAKWVKQNFIFAIENHDYERFALLFDPLSLDDLNLINIGENLELKIPEQNLPTISDKSISLLQEYVDNTGFSGAVSIKNADGPSHTFASAGIDPKCPFAIFSVGKIFTGVLMFISIRQKLISEDALDEPIQLADSVLQKLSTEVREQLTKVTLKQIMLHQSGLGDYLEKYCQAIREAVNNGNLVPHISTCHDLLTFADTEVGPPRYSNLGILLMGLAIEHAYYLKHGQKKSYEEILEEFIIKPVGMSVFSIHKPDNGQYNTADVVIPHIAASPAGGYWTTVEDLQKFGNWVVLLCNKDPEFRKLLEAHGGEFYSHARKEITHSGRMPSASAMLISSLESGTTIAILSQQPNAAPKLSLTILEQSEMDNNIPLNSSATNNAGFFANKKLIDKRNDSPDARRAYDEQYGLVLKKY